MDQRVRHCLKYYNYRSKIVVYTAIFGDRDKLKEPPKFAGVDYICFTDNKSLTSKIWKIVHNTGHDKNPAMSAKIYKILPHRFFQNYEYSLWVDGTHIPVVDIRYLIYKFLAKKDIAMFAHHKRKCIYDEMEACIRGNKDKIHIVERQREKYKKEGYPTKNGLAVCTVILRRHNAPNVQKTMEDWWDEINSYSIRDQLSFNYVAYRNNLDYAVIPGNVYNNRFFKWTKHTNPPPALSIGWILNGTPETATSRIMIIQCQDEKSLKGNRT